MIFSRIVSSSLSPNTQKDDVALALRLLFQPSRWMTGNSRLLVEKWFGKFFNNSQVLTFNSGRSALFAVLRAFGIGSGDEVLVQAFTCVAVPNSVIWTGAKPVYVDINRSLNMDPADVERKITKRTRAIIVQHTFGMPADMGNILGVAKKHKLLVIEDCAHSLGATYHGSQVGTLADASVFSFGRDKVISSVFGGLALVATGHVDPWNRLKEIHDALPYPSGFWVLQQIFHPVAFSLILPGYRMGVGKVLLFLLQKLGLLGFPVYPEEKVGKRPSAFPRKYPNGLAVLLLNQLKKLNTYTKNREKIVAIYGGKGALLRYPMLVDDPKKIIAKAKKHGVLLGNWYHNIIDPAGVKFSKISYSKGSCPRAEYAAGHIINLPTNVSEPEALRVIKKLL